jgi:hypothetical protein
MKRSSLFRILPFRFATIVAPLIAAWPLSSAYSQDVRKWDGAVDLDWGNAANWTAGVNPGVPDGNDTVNLAKCVFRLC